MSDKLTESERKAIAKAEEAGRITRKETRKRKPRKLSPYVPPADDQIASKQPAPRRVKNSMSIQEVLEWAFATEKASIEYDELAASAGSQRQGISMEALLFERHLLGCEIDTSKGRSRPADDAEIVASLLRHHVPIFADAVWIVNLARGRTVPLGDAMGHPRIFPLEWTTIKGGRRQGKTADAKDLGSEGWKPIERQNRRGAIVREAVRYTPCVWEPTIKQIKASRERYLEWWEYLLKLQRAFQDGEFNWFTVNGEMPPMTPWRND